MTPDIFDRVDALVGRTLGGVFVVLCALFVVPLQWGRDILERWREACR